MPPEPPKNKCVFGIEYCTAQEISRNPYIFFIGYQVNSEYYEQTSMNALGGRICEGLKSDLKKYNLQISFEPFGFEPGIHILCDICKIIQKSILCIFEISDLNPNVMLEIGKSQYKNLFLLRNQRSKKPSSDLGGISYDEYDNDKELVVTKSAKIAEFLRKKIIDYHNANTFEETFFLKDDVLKICKNSKSIKNINWDNLLEIYDEDKLKNAHDYTLIGIAKYKKIKSDYYSDKVSIDEFDLVKRYFTKSISLDKNILENYYYLDLLEMFRYGTYILENKKTDYDFKRAQEKTKSIFEQNVEIIDIMTHLFNKNLKEFLFVDSPVLYDLATGYEKNRIGLNNGTKVYNFLRFIDKKGIIKDFNYRVLELLKYLVNSDYERYNIIRYMGNDLKYDDIGDDIIKRIHESLEAEKTTQSFSYYQIIIDKDLKDKLSYLLGCFGDIRAENILISLIDKNIEGVILPAIDALAKINSIRSIPFLINLYKNAGSNYLIGKRAINAINTLSEKNGLIIDII